MYLLVSASAINKDKIAELIINNKPELSNDNVYQILIRANDKNKIAERLGTDNISKLSLSGVISAIVYKKYGQQLAQIINKYHKNKTPEIQEIIDQILLP